jgi:hypothetical protein
MRGGLNRLGISPDRQEIERPKNESRCALSIARSCNRIGISAATDSALAPYKSRNRNAFPDTCCSERVCAIECPNLVSAGRFDQEQAADHLLAIIRDQRAGYHNLDAKARCP